MGSLFSLHVMAGEGKEKDHPEKYCAKLKDGKLVVMHRGAVLNSDVTLANGTVVKTDGTIVKKDGSTLMLKENDCIDKAGKVAEENTNKKSNPK